MRKNLIFFSLLVAFPLLVNAGLFSFVANLFSFGSDTTNVANSQTMALLQAPINSNPLPPSGGADITIVGDTALLPDSNPAGGLSENLTNKPISDQISIYIVREGDTLSTIAKLFGVSINTIRWNNDISGSTINPGQTLVILPVSGIRHTVVKGDTLKSIAKKYGGDIEEIERYNNITSDTSLAIGDIVIVPDGELPATTSSSGATVTSTVKIIGPQVQVSSGYYIRPVPGPKSQGLHGYNAVDLAPPFGTPIVAAADGKVIVSRSGGWNGGYGTYVVIQHPNGTQTLYAHMSRNIASMGSQVVQGQVIGYVGQTGKATGPHLHFEVRGARNPF